MTAMRAAGQVLTVGELREMLVGLPDSDGVYAHGMPIMRAEAGSDVLLDDDADMEEKDQALADLLEFVRRLADDKTLNLKAARGLAADLAEEYGHLTS